VTEAQRRAIPELTRIFGHTGLFMRPFDDYPAELSGNMLASVVSLYRDGRALGGDLRCNDDELPLASDTLSLVYALFPFESAHDPAALMREIARVLKPDGVALLFSLNPWSPTRLRWLLHVGATFGGTAMAGLAADAGLEVVRRRYLGACWASPEPRAKLDTDGVRLFEPLRSASLVVARRHDIPLTLQRKPIPALGLRAGMSPG
jgi:SAM-dependent methyltransferase